MEKILSRDGTPIAYQRSGNGAPLVLVHGTTAAHNRWAPILPALEKHFTVYAIDRRGRGESGDADDYAIEREFEDIAAVVDSIGAEVNLLGHSFGGLCVLGAALLTHQIRRLVLYEPPRVRVPGVRLFPDGFIEHLEALLEAGDREMVLISFFRDLVGVPPDELERLKASPAFPARVAAAHTLPRESRAVENYKFDPGHFKELVVPTLLLAGGDSPIIFKTPIETLNKTLPNSRIVELSGQRHNAMDTAPDLFVREVQAFLLN